MPQIRRLEFLIDEKRNAGFKDMGIVNDFLLAVYELESAKYLMEYDYPLAQVATIEKLRSAWRLIRTDHVKPREHVPIHHIIRDLSYYASEVARYGSVHKTFQLDTVERIRDNYIVLRDIDRKFIGYYFRYSLGGLIKKL